MTAFYGWDKLFDSSEVTSSGDLFLTVHSDSMVLGLPKTFYVLP